MPYKSFARFANLRDAAMPQQANDFVRMPDGSLVMTGNKQVQQPGMLDRIRAAASQIIPAGIMGRGAGPSPPWWIAQPQQAAPVAIAQAPTNASSSSSQQAQWDAIAKEAAHEEALANQLGGFSKKVLSSPQLMEGKWIFPGR